MVKGGVLSRQGQLLRYLNPKIGLVVCVLSGLVLSAGCSGAKVTTQVSTGLPRYQIRTLALVPFTSLATPQVREPIDPYLSAPYEVRRSDISLATPSSAEPKTRQTAVVPEYAAEKVTQLFWVRLRDRPGITVLSPSESARAKTQTAGDAAKLTPEAMAAALAKQLKADAALIGKVMVYQERSGSRLGANPPATVGFEVKVVAADGQLLWVGNYYERQRPMTEDFMGFIQRWAFVTAEELAQYGTEEILKEFPFGSAKE